VNTYIALIRGINILGNNSLPMKELAAILEKLGAKDVRTYIQSGNAVFRMNDKNISDLSERIAKEIGKHRGFEPEVLILEPKSLGKIIKANPFPEGEKNPGRLHVGFLKSIPKNPDLGKMESLRKKTERFHLNAKAFYLYAPEGIGRSKLAASAEKLIGVPKTDRNWRTVCKIMDMSKI
jgi:uncharacterized protein (DUF1697 family)